MGLCRFCGCGSRDLSDEQFDRYTQTVTALLTALGLDVHVPHHRAPGSLEVRNPRTGQTLELDMRDDRSAEWNLEAGDDIPEGTSATGIATQISRILGAIPPGDN
ncbi:hypothetical protein GCM10022402_27050 [Salinactinospora qingdaonensis]|uniref:Uncharacterized protein n=1 Tax=Salinactinospora qingdaonensis TaxID=702744 RepID=A0ABP7FXA8_9ACTN